MLVVCGRCETEYEFDDALLSERGTTVKCTNCGYQFRVRPPRGLQPKGERWEVRGQNGGVLVFQSLRDLRRAIDEDQVDVDDQLSRDGGPLRRLGDVAELEVLFKRKNTRLAPPGHTLMGVGVPEAIRNAARSAAATAGPAAPRTAVPNAPAPNAPAPNAPPPPAPRRSKTMPSATQRVPTIPRPAGTPEAIKPKTTNPAAPRLDATLRSETRPQAPDAVPAIGAPTIPTMPPTTTRIAARRSSTPLGSPRASARTPTAAGSTAGQAVYESFSSEDRKSASFSTFRPPAPDQEAAAPAARNPSLSATWTSPGTEDASASVSPGAHSSGAHSSGEHGLGTAIEAVSIKTPIVPPPNAAVPVTPTPASLPRATNSSAAASTVAAAPAVPGNSDRPTPASALPVSAVQFASVPPPAEPQRMPPASQPSSALPSARPPMPLSVPPPARKTGALRWVIGFVLIGGLALLAGTVGKDYIGQFIQRGEAEADPRIDASLEKGWEAFRDGDIAAARVAFEQASAQAGKDPRVQLAAVQLPIVQADFEWLRLKVLPENASDRREKAKATLADLSSKMNAELEAFVPGPSMQTRKALVETDVLRIRNEFDKARELVESSSFDGTDPHAAYVLAMLDLGQSTPAWATVVERLRTALVSERGLGRARSALVYALAVSGDIEGAKAELGKLVEGDTDHPLASDLGEFVGTLAAGEEPSEPEDEQIVEGAEKPIAGQASASPVWLWLDQAAAARRSGDLAGAATFYKKVLGVNADNASALAGLGAIARLQGNYPEAKGFFDQVLSRSPNNLAALVGGADVRWLMGAKEGAVLLYRKVPSGTAFYSHAQRRIAEFSGGAAAGEGDTRDDAKNETQEGSATEPTEPKPAEPEAPDRAGAPKAGAQPSSGPQEVAPKPEPEKAAPDEAKPTPAPPPANEGE